MPQRLSRRRFSTVTRYLNELIGDTRQPHRLRLRAAERLLDLHERFDRAVERENARGAKGGCKSTPEDQQEQDGVIPSPEPATIEAGEQLAALFEETLRPREAHAAQ